MLSGVKEFILSVDAGPRLLFMTGVESFFSIY